MDAIKDSLISKAMQAGGLPESDVRSLLNGVFEDGTVSAQEADMLFELNESLNGSDPHWDSRFREALRDHLIDRREPPGIITQTESSWLQDKLSRRGEAVIENEIDLLLDILRHADAVAPSFAEFTLKTVCDRIIQKGVAQEADVERVRRALFAPMSEGAVWISRTEAAMLFKVSDAVGRSRNHKSWNALFARAVANHLMAAAHPDPDTQSEVLAKEAWLNEKPKGARGLFATLSQAIASGDWFEKVTYSAEKASEARIAAKEAAARKAAGIDNSEAEWLLKRIGQQAHVNPAEKALLDFIREEIPGFAEGIATAA